MRLPAIVARVSAAVEEVTPGLGPCKRVGGVHGMGLEAIRAQVAGEPDRTAASAIDRARLA